jgi:hypothetical protein
MWTLAAPRSLRLGKHVQLCRTCVLHYLGRPSSIMCKSSCRNHVHAQGESEAADIESFRRYQKPV